MRRISDIGTVIRELKQAFFKRGLVENIRWVGGVLNIAFARLFLKVKWRRRRKENELCGRFDRASQFDKKYGIDTCQQVRLSQLDISEPNWRYGNKYEAIKLEEFDRIISAVTRYCEDRIFIDLGSGKGRAILLASTYPFRKVVGVEISSELTAIANENVSKFPATLRKCQEIHLVCKDAVEYDFPIDRLVLFLKVLPG